MKRWMVWRQWNIRTRLLLIATLPVAYLFCSVVLYSYYSRVKEANEELVERARVVTKALADGIEHDILAPDLPGLKWTINGVVQSDKSIYRIDILDAKKNEIVHVTSFDSVHPAKTIFEAPITRTVIMVGMMSDGERNSDAVSTVHRPDTLGFVRVTMSPTEMMAKQSYRFYFELAMSVMALAVSASLALYLSNSLTDPLQRSIESLQEIRAGDYQAQVDVTTGGEIGVLQESINEMAVSLHESKQNLENKVQERTKELLLSRNDALKADAEKRRLIHKVNSIVEEERKSMALEIHDELNASLIAARLESQRILHLATKEPATPALDEIQAKARAIVKLTLDLYANGRRLVRRLRPEVLDMLGLHGAVEEMLRHYDSNSPDCRFSFESSGDFGKLESGLAISSYRIIQEALSNVVKHAQATNVEVTLHLNEAAHRLQIEIIDDGVGFDVDAVSAGIGITGMRERVYAFDGSIDIQSLAEAEAETGTRVWISLPILPT